MKIAVWILVIANLALLWLNVGHGSAGPADGREPARLAAQLHPESISVLAETPAPASSAVAAPVKAPSTAAASAAVASAASPTTAAPAPAPPAPTTSASAAQAASCVELGNFTAADAGDIEAQLASLGLGDRVSRHPVLETGSYIVYFPTDGTREDAQRKVADLQQLGIKDYFVFPDSASLRNQVSLGVFKVRDAAETHLAGLERRGVHGARIAERKVNTGRVAFQLRNLDAAARTAVDRIDAELPAHALRPCPAS